MAGNASGLIGAWAYPCFGWMAHWAELVRDPEQRIARPRQIYAGEAERTWVPIEKRPEPTMREDAVARSI